MPAERLVVGVGSPHADDGDSVVRPAGRVEDRTVVIVALRFDPQSPSRLEAFEEVVRIAGEAGDQC
jgi:hypothetical protein